MPAKKKTQKKEQISNSFDFQKLVSGSDSYKSLVYGIVTVVVLFVVIALGIRTLQQNRAEIDDNALSTQNMQGQTSTYVVKEGDTLWSIAEKSYNDGFKWNEIAKANNITNATNLEKGMELVIPKIEEGNALEQADEVAMVSPTVAVTVAASPTTMPVKTETPIVPTGQKIVANTYKIVKDDTLWDIAVRAYGDGYRWVELAKVNNISNPDLIYPDNTIKLPR